MLRMLLGVLMIASASLTYRGCFGGGDSCPPQGGSSTEFQPTVFEIEVDYQVDKQPYGGWGSSAVQGVSGDSVCLCFKEDEDTLPPSLIRIERAEEYWIQHSQKWADSTPVYPYYLCGITKFINADSIPYDWLFGITPECAPNKPDPYKTYSFVCLDAGYDDCEVSDNDVSLKACTHELGHQLFGLTHLCKWSDIDSAFVMDGSYHDDEACLMAWGCVAECTGKNVVNNLHFCDMCQSTINTTQK